MADKTKDLVSELEARLRSVNEEFEREMRARGFDPAQVENAALPGALAKLYLERQSLMEQLNKRGVKL
jgi:hypothetical protein